MSELVQLPFARGIDEGADPKGLPAGTPLTLDNCYHDKLGRLVKRPGVSALAASIRGGGSISAGSRLITRGDDLAVFDGTKLYTYSDTLAKWQAVDRPSALTVRTRPLIDVTRDVRTVDIAVSGNLLVSFYEAGTNSTPYLYYEVRRLDTGEVLTSSTYVGAFAHPRVVMNAAGTKAYLFYNDPASTNIYVRTLTMSTLTLSSATTMITNDAGASFDAVVPYVAGADLIYIAYWLNAGASRMRIATYETSGFTVVNTRTITGTLGGMVCIDADGSETHVIYSDTTVYLWTGNGSLTTTTGPTDIGAGNPGNLGVFCAIHATGYVMTGYSYNSDYADAPRMVTAIKETAAHTTSEGGRTSYGVSSCSKPWRVNSRWYVAACARPTNYNGPSASAEAIPNASVVVLELEIEETLTGTAGGPHQHHATLENQIGHFPYSTTYPKAVVSGTTVYLPAAFRTREPPNANNPIPLAFNLHTITVDDVAWGKTALIGAAAIGAAGAPFWWDGTAARPYGFVHAPIIVSAGLSAGGSQAAGTYGYLCAYGWRDSNGVLHRSPVSPSVSGTTAAANLTLAPKMSTTSISSKQRIKFDAEASSPCRMMVWRTELGGSLYYSVVLDPYYGVVYNDPRDKDVTLTDGKADAQIAGAGPNVALSSQPQVYTASGALDDVCPPAAIDALSHLDRAWLLAADGHTVWATKNISDDPTVAPGFNESLTTYFAAPKTCLGALSGAVVVMGEDSIDLITGTGPDATGAGAWGLQGVQTDLGCTSPRSLATIPQGLVYQSRRGIEMLTTGLTIEWIGEAVRDQLETYPNVTSAVVVSDKRQVRISVVNDAEDDGVVLVFDYGRNAWSVWDYGFAVIDAAMIGNVYTILRSSGIVYRESSTSSRDGTTYVSMGADVVVTTSGPNAWQRLKHVQLLGTSVTPHALTMKLKRDFATSYEYEKTFASATEATDVGPLEKVRITPPFQKGQGFVVRIEDSAPDSDDTSDAGSGPILESLALWVQRRPGLPRVSASRRG